MLKPKSKTYLLYYNNLFYFYYLSNALANHLLRHFDKVKLQYF